MKGERVEIVYNGKNYSGTYKINGDWMTVNSPYGSLRASTRGYIPIVLARMMLGQIVRQPDLQQSAERSP